MCKFVPRFYEALKNELHCSKLCFCHENKDAFVSTPWLPYQCKYQVLYLIYRWVIMLYFLAWLAITVVHAADCIKFKYLIFLTHWGFIMWNSYLVLSVITVTVSVYQEHRSSNINTRIGDYKISEKLYISKDGRPNCCSITVRDNTSLSTLTLPYKIQWGLFLVGGEYAIIISILYWSFFYDPNTEQNLYSLDSLNLHMINGVFSIVDLWVSGIPIRLYHAVYPIAFGCVYVLFTAIYYALDGKDPDGNRYIYPFLDYDSNPAAAVGLAVICAVVFVGTIHVIFFLQNVVRQRMTKIIQQSCINASECPT